MHPPGGHCGGSQVHPDPDPDPDPDPPHLPFWIQPKWAQKVQHQWARKTLKPAGPVFHSAEQEVHCRVLLPAQVRRQQLGRRMLR